MVREQRGFEDQAELDQHDSDQAQIDHIGLDHIGDVSPHRIRVIDAMLACLARQGLAKTTVDDVARQAGVSRATVYRAFPGGRDELLAAVVDTEVARLFSALGACMGEADALCDVLVGGIVEAATKISGHAALAYLVVHEPETVLACLAPNEADRLLRTATRFTSPFLARWMDREDAARVAEWAARIVISYVVAPSKTMNLADARHTRHLVETFVLPGVKALQTADRSSPIDITPFTTHTHPFSTHTHPITTRTQLKGDAT